MSTSTFRRKPTVVQATRWFKNGDHPGDGVGAERFDPLTGTTYKGIEGRVVRFFRSPDPDQRGTLTHNACGHGYDEHGWIDDPDPGVRIVCPGDWVITEATGNRYACKSDDFAATYDPEATRSVTASGTEITVGDIAKGLAFGIDDDEIIANGQPLFATDATVDGNVIRWDVDSGRDESFTVVLRVESVTTR